MRGGGGGGWADGAGGGVGVITKFLYGGVCCVDIRI